MRRLSRLGYFIYIPHQPINVPIAGAQAFLTGYIHIRRMAINHQAVVAYYFIGIVWFFNKCRYHSRFIPEGVSEVSQIFLHVLPKLFSYE
jgi:hypothetical protein